MLDSASSLSEEILTSAIKSSASDIHFHPQAEATSIYFRIHGQRHFIQSVRAYHYQRLLSYFKFISGMDIGEVRKPQSGVITHFSLEDKFFLRLSTLPVDDKESLVIRILPQSQKLSLEQLFLFPNQSNILKRWMRYQSGLILFTGQTGSGKSTTLYALLEHTLNEKGYQAITLEDPVEKKLTNCLQVQINEEAGVTYQTGLKAALRHDPDIIMIGEIRDENTAQFAVKAALTGHLVLSTLHAKNAAGTVHRLLEMGLKPNDVEQTLIAVAALELLPIQMSNNVKGRAAIMEQLDEKNVSKLIQNKKGGQVRKQHSFHHLRKKAFAYGYITQETFLNF